MASKELKGTQKKFQEPGRQEQPGSRRKQKEQDKA